MVRALASHQCVPGLTPGLGVICGFSSCLVLRGKNPYSPQGRSIEIPKGRGVLKAKMFQAKYEAKLEFLGGEGAKRKIFCGASMDVF